MTAQDLIRLASENVAAWSAGDWERLRAPFSPDVACYEIGTQRRLQGIDELVAAYKSWKATFPDGTGKIIRSFAGENTVALEVIWSGTHNGPLVGPSGTIPPTGKTFVVPAAQLFIFDEGRIVEFHHYYDLLTMLQQIGAAPSQTEAEPIAEWLAAA
jgi:steroid delta-isomerase-like uncharacterized protein